MTAQEIINQANEIIASDSETKLQGALGQVCFKLNIDEIESVFTELNNKRGVKKVQYCRDEVEGFGINTLHHDVFSAMNNHVIKQQILAQRAK